MERRLGMLREGEGEKGGNEEVTYKRGFNSRLHEVFSKVVLVPKF